MGLIRIHELELDCVVGIRPEERLREQRLRVDVELAVDMWEAAHTGRIVNTVDWNRAAHELTALLRFRQYRLLEVAAHELAAMLLGVHTNARRVKLCLEKPEALEGRARAASVEIELSRQDLALPEKLEQFPVSLIKTCDAELSLMGVAPGERVPEPHTAEQRAMSWLVKGTLSSGDRTLKHGCLPEDCEGAPWVNTGKGPAVLFRCAVFGDSPG